ncbi:S1C family serine protease [Actinopolymorpha pittospori]|uniref:Serine protease PepD n=1 Tax=Actinopolymorpha pittospori TaxID=648752 RepID=A0A927N539_9ACTN|nr:trypsin-like peptidase domain-containing protein [Actinopolymorpha pittospori]MBE1612269.1 putative serine protease PepD [Actinopolymorpha pittospori]
MSDARAGGEDRSSGGMPRPVQAPFTQRIRVPGGHRIPSQRGQGVGQQDVGQLNVQDQGGRGEREVLELGPPRLAWWLGRSRARFVALVAAVAVTAGGLGSVLGGVLTANHLSDSVAGGADVSNVRSLSHVPQVIDTASRSVTDIQVRSMTGSENGSGVILTQDGIILTNNHVVSSARDGGQITVRFGEERQGQKASASIVGTDPASDLALIRADGVSGLTPARLGASSAVRAGNPVVAIGSPEGLEGTVTFGIVSALNREVRIRNMANGPDVTYEAIQTDAPLNPGNSGGPLVDMSARVIGVNSAVYAPATGAATQGLGFAIPIDRVKVIIRKLERPADQIPLGEAATGRSSGGR